MANVEFSGNRAFSSPELYRLIKSKTGTPYVPRQLSEDIDLLQNFYWNNGFDEATVSYELSPGEQKSLLIKINEKRMKRMGEFIIIGASASQNKLLKKLFPLQAGQPFSKEKIDAFRTEIENSAIFSQVKLDKIAKGEDRIDVLVKVIPDRSRFTVLVSAGRKEAARALPGATGSAAGDRGRTARHSGVSGKKPVQFDFLD